MKYQEGATSTRPAACVCGTFAIGLCARCGKPVCGTHSGLFSGARLCSDDWHAASDEAKRAEEGRAADEANATAERRRQRDAELDRVKAWLVSVATQLRKNGAKPNASFDTPGGSVRAWEIAAVDSGATTQDAGFSSAFGEPHFRRTETFLRERVRVLTDDGRLAVMQRRKGKSRWGPWELDGYKFLDVGEVDGFLRSIESRYGVTLSGPSDTAATRS